MRSLPVFVIGSVSGKLHRTINTSTRSSMPSKNYLFTANKSRILSKIDSPVPDTSPKGSVDVQILPLIRRLNQHSRVFTTSSCSGRISIFLEGLKKNRKPNHSGENRQESGTPVVEDVSGKAGMGGKGEGGKWLFVSHDPVDVNHKSDREVFEMLLGKRVDGGTAVDTPGSEEKLEFGSGDLDISSITRFVHLKFEPMILHVQTFDLQTAHVILTAALSAGFRESGIMNPGLRASSSPMVAIRCNGLAIDSIIGIVDCSNGRIRNIVDGTYLRTLVKICNLRFGDNKRRVNNFGANIEDVLFKDTKEEGKEGKEARKLRKREEGLEKQVKLNVTRDIEGGIIEDDTGGVSPSMGFFFV